MKPVKFNIKQLTNDERITKTQKELSKILDFVDRDKQPNKEEKFICMTEDNVLMIVSKTELGKEMIKPFCEADDKRGLKEINLDYKFDVDWGLGCLYNTGYLDHIIKILMVGYNKVKLTTKKDYPLTAENDDLKIVLAPMIE